MLYVEQRERHAYDNGCGTWACQTPNPATGDPRARAWLDRLSCGRAVSFFATRKPALARAATGICTLCGRRGSHLLSFHNPSECTSQTQSACDQG